MSVVQIVSEIRNKLMDFMSELDREFGNATEFEQLTQKKEAITKIMNKTIINTGHGNVINTGASSKIDTCANVTIGNKDELRNKLEENEVSNNDIRELLEIVDTETYDTEQKKFGFRVNTWLEKMLSKSLDGTWQVGIATAGNILSQILCAYYGVHMK